MLIEIKVAERKANRMINKTKMKSLKNHFFGQGGYRSNHENQFSLL